MKQVTVELEDFKVVVNKLRVRNVRRIVANFYDLLQPKEGEELNVSVLLGDRFDDAIDVFSEFIIVKNKKDESWTLEDVTDDDILKLVEVVKELNSGFLMIASTMAQSMMQQEVEALPTQTNISED